MVRIILIGLFGLFSYPFLFGCSTVNTPNKVIINNDVIDIAWKIALETIREEGYETSYVDQMEREIQCKPKNLGTIFEFWRNDHRSLKQALDATARKYRRNLKIQFVPLNNEKNDFNIEKRLSGPNPLDPLKENLYSENKQIEMLIWANLEIFHRPSKSLNTWTKKGDDFSIKSVDNTLWEQNSESFWEPIRLDNDYCMYLSNKILKKIINFESVK